MAAETPRDMLGRSSLLSVARAKEILHDALSGITPAEQSVPLAESLGRITARPVISPEDLPSHARSTMDGFALRSADTFGATESMPAYITISGEVLMGEQPTTGPEPGCCFRIATGGLLPPGTDSVVMFEHTVAVDDTMIEVNKSVGSGGNVIRRGDDIEKGDVALAAGRKIHPRDIGLLAGLGITTVKVYEPLKVAIIATGDEIVPLHEPPPPGKVRNINSAALIALITEAGHNAKDYGIISDDREPYTALMKKAVADNDIIIFSGSSSVGMRDLGEQVLSELGKPGILVHGVALRPGKPIIIARCDNQILFGLPGHPVSALVCFDVFIKPAIQKLSGLDEQITAAPVIRGKLMRPINSAAGRRDYVRVQVKAGDNDLEVYPVLAKSGAISSLSRADGYLIIKESSQGIDQDTEVTVELFT